MAAPEARLVEDEHAGSPALVVVAYQIRPEIEDEFLRALRLVGRVRRRTGATDWSVYRDADKPYRFVETFVLSSWDEHMRQHQRRTVTDFELQQELHRFLVDGYGADGEALRRAARAADAVLAALSPKRHGGSGSHASPAVRTVASPAEPAVPVSGTDSG